MTRYAESNKAIKPISYYPTQKSARMFCDFGVTSIYHFMAPQKKYKEQYLTFFINWYSALRHDHHLQKEAYMKKFLDHSNE